MHSCKIAVVACTLFVMGCAAAAGADSPAGDSSPENCAEHEGPCVQSGAI